MRLLIPGQHLSKEVRHYLSYNLREQASGRLLRHYGVVRDSSVHALSILTSVVVLYFYKLGLGLGLAIGLWLGLGYG